MASSSDTLAVKASTSEDRGAIVGLDVVGKPCCPVAALAARLRGIRTEPALHVYTATEILMVLAELDAAAVDCKVLKESKVGLEVNCPFLRKHDDQRVREACGALVKRWKGVFAATSGSSKPPVPVQPPPAGDNMTGSGSVSKVGATRALLDSVGMQACANVCYRDNAAMSDAVRSRLLKRAARLASSSAKRTAQRASSAAASSSGRSLAQRQAALKEGSREEWEAALLTEVKDYLCGSTGKKASMGELNSHVQRIWDGPSAPGHVQRRVIDRSLCGKNSWKSPSGPNDAPVVGKNFVDRHSDVLSCTKRKSSNGGKTRITGLFVHLRGGGDQTQAKTWEAGQAASAKNKGSSKRKSSSKRQNFVPSNLTLKRMRLEKRKG